MSSIPGTTGSRSSTPRATSWAPGDGASRRVPTATRPAHIPARRGRISGPGNGQFSFSYRDDNDGIATDPSGNVYVADTQNNRIEKFSSSGAYLAKWGYPGTGDEQFYPEALATDPSGNVYVVDRSNYRILKFHDGFAVGRSGSTLVVTATPGAKDNLVITRPSASSLRVTGFPSGAYTGSGPRGNGLHSKRRLHGQLQRRRDHPDSSHRRRSGRQGRQLDRRSKLALRRERLGMCSPAASALTP